MSIEQGSETLTVSKQERTWRIECFCENGTDYELVAHRETLTLAADGTVISQDRGKEVRRKVSEVVNQPDAMQFLGLAKALCDRWASEG